MASKDQVPLCGHVSPVLPTGACKAGSGWGWSLWLVPILHETAICSLSCIPAPAAQRATFL